MSYKTDYQNQISQYMKDSRYDQALELLGMYRRQFGKDDFYYLSYSDILMSIEDYQAVIDCMQDAKKEDVFSDYLNERLADAYFAKGELEKAQEIYSSCNIQDDTPHALHIRYMLGLVSFQLHHYATAISYFEDVLMDQPNQNQALILCGLSYAMQEDIIKCNEYLNQYIQQNAQGIYDICSELLVLKQYSLAYQYILKIPDSIKQKEYLVQYFIVNNNLVQAIEVAKTLCHDNPTIPHWNELAELYKSNGELDLSKNYYDLIIEAPDDNTLTALQNIKYHLYAYRQTNNRNYNRYVLMHLDNALKDIDIFIYLFHFAQAMEDLTFCEWFIDRKPFFHDIQQENEYHTLVMRYYLRTHKYLRGLQYLESLDPESFVEYNKLRVVFAFYNCQFDQVYNHYQAAMPNGLVAYMAFVAMGLLHKEKQATDFLARFMDYASEHPEVDDLDIFYELIKDIQKNSQK